MALMATQYKLFEVGRCSKSELSATQYSTMAKLMDDDPKLAALVQSGKNDAVVRHVCEGFSANLNGASFLVKGPMMVRPDIDYDPDRD